MPFRQIHLDFHTSPHIPGVGERFDPADFAAAMVAAKVNSVTLFAKCHHGHLYYDTSSPARHPQLARPLLEEQIAALHEHHIRTPIYLSVQCDEYAANEHPDWIALSADGLRVGQKPLAAEYFNWQILDMSSPYADYLAEQISEVITRFRPVDGIFLDMCWDQPSVSAWAKKGMAAAGLDPANSADRAIYARQVVRGYMSRYRKLIDSHQSDVPLWFNSRPLIRLGEEKHLLQHVEVEALPTGQWGYAYLPVQIRYAKTLGLPLIAMTARFHKSWADFGGLRTVPSLLYDCAQALAHGAGCSIGDQLHPSGQTDHGVYETIGAVYAHVERCEPWCRDVTTPREIAVLMSEESVTKGANRVMEGVMRALNQLRYQFVFLREDAWEDYPVLIVPEYVSVSPQLQSRLDQYAAKGGKLLVEDLTGEASPYTATYLRFSESSRGPLEKTDHVFYEQGVRLLPQPGDEVLAFVVEPYFERRWDHFSSHAQTPATLEPSPFAAAVVRPSRAIFALPVFRAYATHGNIPCRQLIAAALARLLPEPLLRISAPSYVEAVVSDRPAERIIHLLSFLPQKRTPTQEIVEEAVPARQVRLDVKVDRAVDSVTLAPQGKNIPYVEGAGRCAVELDWIEGHQIIALRYADQIGSSSARRVQLA